jgi:hypothetical protein
MLWLQARFEPDFFERASDRNLLKVEACVGMEPAVNSFFGA